MERIGFLDIETSNLKADFGVMLSYCIGCDGKVVCEGVITPADLRRPGEEDARIVTQAVKDIAKFDRIVTYYGKRFDIPFLRTRALVCKVPFPLHGTLVHTDLYDVVRHKLCLHRNRLEVAARTVLGKTDKTHLEPKYWRAALRGDKAALAYILDHNRKDVLDLEKLYRKIIQFSKLIKSSI